MFAAPAPAGEITGESHSVGLRGFALTMPELRLELPTLHLPSMVRSRRNPEMRVDGGRAPMVSGAPAAYGQLANAGFVQSANAGFAQTQAAPAAAPARTAPAAAPAAAPASGCVPAESCVPFYIPPAPAAYPEGARNQRANDELLETRRALVLYRQELERLQRSIESTTSSVDAPEEDQLPALNIRGASSAHSRPVSSNKVRRASPPKILEAGYTEEEFTESEEVAELPTRPVASPRNSRSVAAPAPSAPGKRSVAAPRQIEQPVPPNVGFSFITDEVETADDGLGIWKGAGQRPAPKRVDGSGKRSSR